MVNLELSLRQDYGIQNHKNQIVDYNKKNLLLAWNFFGFRLIHVNGDYKETSLNHKIFISQKTCSLKKWFIKYIT